MSKTKFDLAESVLKSLRAEKMPWRSSRGIPANPATGNAYSGINVLTLDAVATQHNYRSKWWGTYQQWHSIGMQVARRPSDAAWGTPVVNWETKYKIIDKGDILTLERFGLMKKHYVFNAEQVFGRDLNKWLVTLNQYLIVDYSMVESLIAASGAVIYHDATYPHYDRGTDNIFLPDRTCFLNQQQYIATKIHELFHWVEDRTGWDGPEDQGEFAAEIGTGYLESIFGLPHDADMTNCLKWLPAWVYGIETNPEYLFKAAAQAAKGLEFLLSFGLQSQKPVVE